MGNNVHCLRKVKLGGKDCTFKVREIIYIYFLSKNGVEEVFLSQGEKICNGAVTKEIGSTTLQLCVNGKVRYKPLHLAHCCAIFLGHLGIEI